MVAELHALACLYRPCGFLGERNYFTRFFKRENGVTWTGSKLSAEFTINDKPSNTSYEKQSDRWTPRIDQRPQRDVKYIGINSCVPDIEQATITTSKYTLGADEAVEERTKIIAAASRIMVYNYEDYTKASCRKKKYKKVTNGTLHYSSLSLGAGKQRLFSILEVLYSIPAYSLLLIDELDLTLHTSALMKLVDEMVEVANNRNELLTHIAFHRFGAIENAFVVAAGLDIQEADSENKIFLMDGDKYRTEEERLSQMKRYYSESEVDKDKRRKRALSHIKQYILPENEHPEHFLWNELKKCNNDLAEYAQQIKEIADDKHKYLYDIQKESGESREGFLTRLTAILAQQDFWSDYVKELQEWLESRKTDLQNAN